jgi:hypothetical protein
MKIGIVGSEGIKFTPIGEARARDAIQSILRDNDTDTVVSGHCHLGGIDIWAEEEGLKLGLKLEIYPPRDLTWSGGFKPRNLQIAHNSDIIYCITVDDLPDNYTGMRFKGCYHCEKSNDGFKGDHIKSGGCWTVLQAIKKGKVGRWIRIENW